MRETLICSRGDPLLARQRASKIKDSRLAQAMSFRPREEKCVICRLDRALHARWMRIRTLDHVHAGTDECGGSCLTSGFPDSGCPLGYARVPYSICSHMALGHSPRTQSFA
jgi:hypothetical protein